MKIFTLKTMTREDIARSLWMSKTQIFRSSFSSLLSHRNHHTIKWGPREPVRMTEVMLNQNPMSSSEDYESESCPESDKSALLVAQVKLPCEFEIPLEHMSVP